MHRARLLLAIGLLSFAVAAQCAEPKAISAVYAHNELSLSAPYVAAHSGEAELSLEVLTPEDRVLGQTVRMARVAEGGGVWNARITLREPMGIDELVWQRVRFSLRYTDHAAPDFEEIRSLSEILVRPALHILAQRSYIAGAQAAMRVIVARSSSDGEQAAIDPTIDQGTVRIELGNLNQESKQGSNRAANRAPALLFTGPLDKRGSADAEFRFPEGLTGSFPVRFIAETPLGQVETTQTIELEDRVSVLLTSEKPIYQPSQTIHLRALALDRADHHAAAGRALTFEVEDPRGNKVFRKAASTDSFGVASAEFTLADEVNLGAYHIRTKMSDSMGDGKESAAELTVNVERYVLPKFRVAVEFDAKDGKPRRDYRPGDRVTGTVKANYFFGKPVADAEVAIKASAMDAELLDAATAIGRTDSDGAYRFSLVLPRFFAGQRAGVAPVVVEAAVKDAAGHAETRGEPITVSQSSLLLAAVPEGGKLVPGIANDVYLLASYPDGTPARADLVVHAGGAIEKVNGDDVLSKVTTSEAGIAAVRMTGDDVNTTLRIEADDRKGNHASETLHLETRDGADQVLVRTARAVVKPGDRMEIEVLSTRQRGAAYIDLVHNGQTILTRDADLENGRAQLSVAATAEMSGTLAVSAYVIGRNGREIADRRLVFVEPADELHIDAETDAASYLPGGEANVRFHVTNQKGEGVSAALGLEVVDQAVFALAEKEPGFAKVFFYLEEELMKPHYEIHSLAPTEIVEPVISSAAESQDRAARVLFAAAETVAAHTLEADAGRALPETQRADYVARYRDALLEYVKGAAAKMTNPDSGEDTAAAARRALEMLRNAAQEQGDFISWSATETGVYATGDSAAVETTGLAAQAFLEAGGYSDVARKALAWITSKKMGDGNWGSTQATIMALRALLMASGQSGSDARGAVEVLFNGTEIATLDVDERNNDLPHQFVMPKTSAGRDNEVEIRFTGEGGMAYQIAGEYFVPWQRADAPEPLAIEMRYDRTRLAEDEIVTATATIHSNMEKTAKMVMVDLGIPPGFELLSEDLESMVEKTAGKESGRLEKFNLTATQAILYFDSIAPRDSFDVQFRLRAKYPIHAQGFASRVYEYYDPNVSATAKPAQFEVIAR